MKIEKPIQKNAASVNRRTQSGTVAHHQYADILGAELPLVSARFENETPASSGYIYVVKNVLCIEHLAKLPVTECIKTNLPAEKVVKLHLRSPMKPDSWWGKCPRRLTVGLTALEYTKYRLQTGFAKVFLVVSMVTIALGVLSNPWLIAGGIVGFSVSSLMHAFSPVWYQEVSKEFTSVKGVSREYLKQFDLIDKNESNSLSSPAQTRADRFIK